MLPCQQLGGGHDNGLTVIFKAQPCASGGNQGLARADIALNKAVHAVYRAHIGKGLRYGPFLSIGGPERQLVIEESGVIMVEHAGYPCLGLPFEPYRSAAEDIKLLEGEPSPCLGRLFKAVGEMYLMVCLFGIHKAQVALQLRGQGRCGNRADLEGGSDPLLDHTRGYSARKRIHRKDPAGDAALVSHLFKEGVHKAGPSGIALHLAVENILGALFELVFRIRSVKKDKFYTPRVVKCPCLDQFHTPLQPCKGRVGCHHKAIAGLGLLGRT